MNQIKKIIIPIAGLATRFLPLSKTVPKELWPLVDKPLIHYIVEEAIASGVNQIVLVVRPGQNLVKNYFKREPRLEATLKARKKENFLQQLRKLEELLRGVTISCVYQQKQLGDGHAVLQAKKAIGDEAFGVLFIDDIVEAKTPAFLQLVQIFKTYQKPIVALYQIPRAKASHYGMVGVDKIAQRLYKIKEIIEKPDIEAVPSDLAIVGKYILTPEVFHHLKKAPCNKRGEIILADVLMQMISQGNVVYGYAFEGKWLECGDVQRYLASNLYLSLKHPEFGPYFKKILKEITS